MCHAAEPRGGQRSAKVQIGLRPVQRCKSERRRFGWQVAAPGGGWRQDKLEDRRAGGLEAQRIRRYVSIEYGVSSIGRGRARRVLGSWFIVFAAVSR